MILNRIVCQRHFGVMIKAVGIGIGIGDSVAIEMIIVPGMEE